MSISAIDSSSKNQFKVYVTQPIPKEAINILKNYDCNVIVNENIPLNRNQFLDSIKNIDALFCTLNERIDGEALDRAGKNLKIVATCSVGTDHIDIKECYRRNIKVGYTPGVLTDATTEYAIALLLSVARRVPEGLIAAKTGEWSTWKILWMCGKGLKGSTIGIFGLGRIGLAIAKRLQSFEVNRIIYTNRNPNPEADKIGCEYVDFDSLLANSDFLICCCAATNQTFKIFNKNAFNKMKSDSIFVNISRGTVVNQEDLYDALNDGIIGYAALDVTTPEPLPLDHKLFKLKNCLISPHICSAETNTRVNMATITAQNIVNGLNCTQLLHEVNRPSD